MTPEEKIAEFLHNLSVALFASNSSLEMRGRILIAAVPAVTKYYLKGQ